MFSISSGIKRQLIATLTSSLAALIAGCMIGWAAPTLKKLRQSDSSLRLSSYQEGLVVSALYFGQLLSPFPSGFIMHKLGPKRSLLFLDVLPTISWILVYFSTSARMLMAARLLSGLWQGAILTLVPIYIAEISAPHVRGVFGSFFLLNAYIGYNFSFIFAPVLSLQVMAIICSMLCVLFLILVSYCPDSPYYYVMQKDSESAARSLNWLRGGASAETASELVMIQTSVEKEKRADDKCLKNLAALITVPANRKAFITVGVVSVMDKLCGVSCIVAFSAVILPPYVGPLTSYQCLVIIGLVSILSVFMRAVLTRNVGRKTLLYYSSFGICVSAFWTGVWYILNTEEEGRLNWVPLAGILVFMCAYSIGLGPTIAIYQGEMFPSNLKRLASPLTTMIAALSDTIITALFPVVSEKVGVYANFFVFAAAGFVTLLFTRFYIIETEGKSLQTIQAELNGVEADELKKVEECVRSNG